MGIQEIKEIKSIFFFK